MRSSSGRRKNNRSTAKKSCKASESAAMLNPSFIFFRDTLTPWFRHQRWKLKTLCIISDSKMKGKEPSSDPNWRVEAAQAIPKNLPHGADTWVGQVLSTLWLQAMEKCRQLASLVDMVCFVCFLTLGPREVINGYGRKCVILTWSKNEQYTKPSYLHQISQKK